MDKKLTLLSPDGKNQISFILEDGKIYYSARRHYKTTIKRSRIQISLNEASSLGALEFVNSAESFNVSDWEPVVGQWNKISNRYNELMVELNNTKEYSNLKKFVVFLRAYDDGVAFRYEIPKQDGLDKFTIKAENTCFRVSKMAQAWWIPAYQPDRYEYIYQKTLVVDMPAVHTPLTIEITPDSYVSIHEAALYNYGAMVLKYDEERKELASEITPLEGGEAGNFSESFSSPWRVIIQADKAIDLISSTIVLNLNPAPHMDMSWVKPLKFMGIWWGMFVGEFTWESGERHGATTENAIEYIDYCAEYGIPGLLIEGWNEGWDGDWTKNGHLFNFTSTYDDFDIREVARYAKEKGVQLVGHHETSGDIINYEAQLEDAFKFYDELGIKYIKTGYVGSRMNHKQYHHSQFGVSHYQQVVEKAAEHQIMLDIHEPIKGTGIERTWPNLLTREGARGQEYEGGGIPPSHVPNIVFTRMLSGAFDYTPGIFDIANPVKRVTSTLARQLALYVIVYSPMQMVADRPKQYKNYMDAFKFIQDVPVDWAATVPVAGAIGDYVIIARRDKYSKDWYVGGVTGDNERVVHFELSFLSETRKYTAEIYQDGDSAHWRDNQHDIFIYDKEVTSSDSIRIRIAPGGGFAIRLKAHQDSEMGDACGE